MAKNPTRTKAHRMGSSPPDHGDDQNVASALQLGQKGAGVDFVVTEKLFYRLTKPDIGNQDWFDFSGPSVRWRDQFARSAEDKVHTIMSSEVANLEFPTKLSSVARWYDWARTFIDCEFPHHLLKVLAAQSWDEASAVLKAWDRSAAAALGKAVAKLLATPEMPVQAYFRAKLARGVARERERTVKSCIEAMSRAREVQYEKDVLTEVKIRGVADSPIDYSQFLTLTTFGPHHLGDSGAYSLRMDGTRVVGIGPGAGLPPHHPLYTNGDMVALAEHQSDSLLDLPTTIESLVIWVFRQAGGVELAIPDSDEYPVEPHHWANAVENLIKVQAGVRLSSRWNQVSYSPNAKAIQRLVVDAVNGLQSLDVKSPAVISWLASNASQREVAVSKSGEYEYHNGAAWVALETRAVGEQLNALRKRLRAGANRSRDVSTT